MPLDEKCFYVSRKPPQGFVCYCFFLDEIGPFRHDIGHKLSNQHRECLVIDRAVG